MEKAKKNGGLRSKCYFSGGSSSAVTCHMRRKNCKKVSDTLTANISEAEEQFWEKGGCFCFSLA